MAEGLFRALSARSSHSFHVQSAGVAAAVGSPASENTQAVLEQRDIDCGHFCSKGVTESLLNESDYIFCMTSRHREAIVHHFPVSEEKVFLLGEFLEDDAVLDFADPFGMNLEAYEYVGEQLDIALPNALEFIESSLEEQ